MKKTQAVPALDALLAALGIDDEPKRADEIASNDLIRLGMCSTVAREKLLGLYRAGQYSRRRVKGEYLYRKI
jgi:hypothetical protein